MVKTLKVGILRETKNPPDRRVPLTPPQIVTLQEMYPHVEFYVQPSDHRAYTNNEYEYLNIPLKEDLRDCDILLGVKEIDRRTFIPGKTYLFFAHVVKKQPHNREMFREMAAGKLTFIDPELLTTDDGQRVVAFGRFAGIVGAYNALRARGIKTNKFRLKPAYQCRDLDEMWAGLRLIEIKNDLRVLVTGGGRVSGGIMETLAICNIEKVSPADFLKRDYEVSVYTQLLPEHYLRHKEGKPFNFADMKRNPGEYESVFLPYTKRADILVTGHFWDPRSPVFFTKKEMKNPGFRISVIADVSCDINGGIPSTMRATTISDPFYAYNPFLEAEDPEFSRPSNITVMSIDNLPGELPRDASLDFGRQLISNVMHDLLMQNKSPMIKRATVLEKGRLTEKYRYLKDYLTP
ncbi:MAG TPA: NAD(P)-dependent oxidoreductase [Bacteroidales bacterium]|jgi:alanine dehydrogenase|nr:NAD(P)-dependent oxidoreductase [Bacteroidales bacterium]